MAKFKKPLLVEGSATALAGVFDGVGNRVWSDVNQGVAADTQRVQRLEAATAATIARLNEEHRQRADAAAPFTEDWRTLTAWRTTGTPAVGSGRLWGGSGTAVVRDVDLAPGETGVFRAEFYSSGTGGQQVLVGVSNNALGAALPSTDTNGVFIGVNGTQATLYTGSNVSSVGLASSGAYPVLANGYYLATIVVDPDNITLTLQAVGANKAWLSTRLPRTSMPGGTGQVNSVAIGVSGSSGPGPSGQTTVGPMTGIVNDHQPPAWVDQRTVGGRPLWDSVKATVLFRTSPTTGIRWAIRIPGNYSPYAPSPLMVFLHPANGDVMTAFNGNADNLIDLVADPGNMILATSDGGVPGSLDQFGKPAGTNDLTELVEWVRRNFATSGLHLVGCSGGGFQMFNALAERRIGGITTATSAAGASDLQAVAADPAFQSSVYGAWGASSPSTLAAAAAGRDPALQRAAQYRGVPVYFTHYATENVLNLAANVTAMKAKLDAWGAAETVEQIIAGTGHTGTALYTSALLTFMQKHEGGAPARTFGAASQDYSDLNPPSSLMITDAAEPATPPAGKAVLYSTDGTALLMKDDTGVVRTVGPSAGGGGGSGTELAATTDYVDTMPSLPATGLKLFSRNRSRRLPAFVGPTGQDSRLQPAIFSNQVCWIKANNNNNTLHVQGVIAAVNHFSSGTTSANSTTATGMSTGSFYGSMVRTRLNTSTAAATVGRLANSAPQWQLSTTPNLGGFHFVCRFGLATAALGTRGFVGMSPIASSFVLTANPSGLPSLIGFGWDAADTNMSFICTGSGGTGTKTSLGANFPTSTSASTYFYEASFYAPSGAGQLVFWSITRINDGITVSGTVGAGGAGSATMLPVATPTGAVAAIGNGTLAATHSMDFQSMYIESDN